MVRNWHGTAAMSVLLIGLLLASQMNCDSTFDDEEDDEEMMDDYETSGSSTYGDEANVERPSVDLNTYRDDQKPVVQHQAKIGQHHEYNEDEFEETTVDSPGNQFFAGSDEHDSDAFDDDLIDYQSEGTTSAQPSPPSNQQSTAVFTYQNNRSKLLNIIKKPGILAGIVGGAIIGILTAILLIMFIVYRMRKKDEGSYALEETKKPLNAYDYRHCPTKEFYA